MTLAFRWSPQATLSPRSVAKRAVPSSAPRKWPSSVTPIALERPEVQVVAAAVARRLDVRHEPCARLRQVLDAIVEVARRVEPPDDVVVPDPPRGPARAAARQEDVATRLVELLGDLAARLPAADHEHRARRQLAGVAVVLHVDLEQVAGQRRRARRPVRPLVRAGAEDDVRGDDVPG